VVEIGPRDCRSCLVEFDRLYFLSKFVAIKGESGSSPFDAFLCQFVPHDVKTVHGKYDRFFDDLDK
jgi:hypothetical protein